MTVAALGCTAGDLVAVSPTGFDPLEAEILEVASCSGSTVHLAQPLEYDHFGAAEPLLVGSVEVRLVEQASADVSGISAAV